jgi:tetratricopeptide (TPR) repeat protein
MAMLSSSNKSETITTYKCKKCGRTFFSEEEVKDHIRAEHPDFLEDAISCPLCGKKFKNSEQLQIIFHMMQKHPEKFQKINDRSTHMKEEMAIKYSKLGNIYKTRGKLDKAVEMFQKSLKINRILDRKVGMAIAYSNLGSVYKTHGKLDKAVGLWRKSIQLFSEIKHHHAATVKQ